MVRGVHAARFVGSGVCCRFGRRATFGPFWLMGWLANAACVHCLVLLPLTCSFYGFATDIVFCRTWVPVEAKKFYNPVSSLLGPLRAPDSEDGAGAAKLG